MKKIKLRSILLTVCAIIMGAIYASAAYYGFEEGDALLYLMAIIIVGFLFVWSITFNPTRHHCIRCGVESGYEELMCNAKDNEILGMPVCDKCKEELKL